MAAQPGPCLTFGRLVDAVDRQAGRLFNEIDEGERSPEAGAATQECPGLSNDNVGRDQTSSPFAPQRASSVETCVARQYFVKEILMEPASPSVSS